MVTILNLRCLRIVFFVAFILSFVNFPTTGFSLNCAQENEADDNREPSLFPQEIEDAPYERTSGENDVSDSDKDGWTRANDERDRVVLVIAPPVFHDSLQRWIEYRQGQGYKILLLPLAQISEDDEGDDFSHPVASPSEIREKIRKAASGRRVEAILLVGDGAPTDSALYGWRDVVPAPRVPALVVQIFGSEELLASDSYYADIDDDGFPDAPIGRLPVETTNELDVCIDNIIRYEQDFPIGNWTRKINVVAGPNGLDLRAIGSEPGEVLEGKNPFGGVSMLVTSIVDKIARKLFADYLPQEFVLSLTQFSPQSPFCPYPADFEKKTIERINEGSLFWAYLGHGRAVGLDRYLAPSGKDYGVLEIEDCAEFNCEGHPPIMLFFACYTGAYDASCRCLAEEALLQKNGPAAVLAASRRTAPYGMCYFGSTLLEAAFSHNPAENATKNERRSLGALYFEAQRRALEDAEEDELDTDELDFSAEEGVNVSKKQASSTISSDHKELKLSDRFDWIDERLQKSLKEAEEFKRKNASFRKTIDQIAAFFDPTASRLNDQLRDHIAEFNLFGDPLLQIKFPTRVSVEASEIVYSVEEITVSGRLPLENGTEAIVQAELVPADFRPKFSAPTRPKAFSESEETRREFNETYEKANAFVVDAVRTKTKNGRYVANLKVPEGFSGECVARIAAASNDQQYFVGSKRILVRPQTTSKQQQK